MFSQLNTSEVISLLTLIVTAVGVVVTTVYTIFTLLLWRTTKKSVEINTITVKQLVKQVDHQIALNNATSDHNISDSHRNLFLSILQNPKFAEIFAENSDVSEEVLQRDYLATFLINHCSTSFYYQKSRILSQIHLKSYAEDARYLFTMPFIRKRWKQVKNYHSEEFQSFVGKFLLSDKEINFSELALEIYAENNLIGDTDMQTTDTLT